MFKNLWGLFVSPVRNITYESKLDKLKKRGKLSADDIYASFDDCLRERGLRRLPCNNSRVKGAE